jgi:orotate phosphoribosyltransferase
MNILDIYKRHGALLEGHFLLSSGLHSDKFLQSALIMQYPYIAEKIVSEIVDKLYDIKFTTVVSPAIGGIRFGYELARQMQKRALFTERIDGEMMFRRGFSLEKGELVLIAEDIVTTGKSTRECMSAVEKAGGNIVGITTLVDRSGGKAEFDVPFYPLMQIEVQTFEPDNCPLCKKGSKPIKPGSRKF